MDEFLNKYQYIFLIILINTKYIIYHINDQLFKEHNHHQSHIDKHINYLKYNYSMQMNMIKHIMFYHLQYNYNYMVLNIILYNIILNQINNKHKYHHKYYQFSLQLMFRYIILHNQHNSMYNQNHMFQDFNIQQIILQNKKKYNEF